MDSLVPLYPQVASGGYVIVDDYGVEMFNCKDAVDDFRAAHGVREPLRVMTDYIHFWQKAG